MSAPATPRRYGPTTQPGYATQTREMQREMARMQREAERAGREQARREASAQAAANRARLQREREITQVGTTLLRGVMGTLFGSRRR